MMDLKVLCSSVLLLLGGEMQQSYVNAGDSGRHL